MAGPTTEVLNEDIKELKAEIKDIRSDMATMRADVHAIAVSVAKFEDIRPELAALKSDVQRTAVDLAEFKGEARLFMRVATWAGALVVTTALTGGVAAVWWAARSTERGDQLTVEVRRLADAVAKIEARQAPAPMPDGAAKGE